MRFQIGGDDPPVAVTDDRIRYLQRTYPHFFEKGRIRKSIQMPESIPNQDEAELFQLMQEAHGDTYNATRLEDLTQRADHTSAWRTVKSGDKRKRT